MHIGITGAAGNVGQVAIDTFSNHTVTAFTHHEDDDIDSVVLDVTDRDAFVEALAERDVDVLVHLAAIASPSKYYDWDDLKAVNIEGDYNAYYAAVENDLDRVVYASSNHAVNMSSVAEPDEPETMARDAPTVYHDTPPCPDSFYGVTKVTGEAIGNYHARRGDIETVNVRIGWLMTPDELRATQEDSNGTSPKDRARFARAMWLSFKDCSRVLAAAATADLPESPLTVHGISRNDDRYLSLTHSLRTIGYNPRDNSGEVI